MNNRVSAIASIAVRRTIKQCAADMLYYSGLLRLYRAKGVRILAYHRISDERFVLPGMSITTAHFERHLRHLARHCAVLPLEQAVEMIRKRIPLPAGAAVVTFDDGYKDNYSNAWPLLEKYRLPATVFLSVGAIEERNALWFDIVTEAFRATKKRSFSVGGDRPALPLESADDRLSAAAVTVESGKRLAPRDRQEYVRRVLERLEVRREALPLQHYMMDWGEVARMSGSTISFGSHGMSHCILTNLSLPELEYELRRSREIIRERTGIAVTAFAYPNGGRDDFNEDCARLLARCGYTVACTLVKGSNDGTTGRYALRRFCVTGGMGSGVFGNYSDPLFAVSLSGLFARYHA